MIEILFELKESRPQEANMMMMMMLILILSLLSSSRSFVPGHGGNDGTTKRDGTFKSP